MTKTIKLWMVVLSAVVVVSGAAALMPVGHRARAQDAQAQTLTPAELLTVTLLQQIVSQLIELNRNVERLPSGTAQ